MAYKVLSDTEITDLNDEYKTLLAGLAGENDNAEKAKITAKLQSVGTQAEEHLNVVGREIRAYYTQHSTKVDNWLRMSEQAIVNAHKAAADYKKDPSKGVPAQPQQAAADTILWAKAIADDAQEFGAAWFSYRNAVAPQIPIKYKDAFNVVRGQVME